MPELLTLELRGRRHQAMDLVFDHIDDLLLAARFEEVDGILATIDRQALSTDVLLTFLTATRLAAPRLTARASFFQEVKALVESRAESEDGLFEGLDGQNLAS